MEKMKWQAFCAYDDILYVFQEDVYKYRCVQTGVSFREEKIEGKSVRIG